MQLDANTMKDNSSWQYNEFTQVGKDYSVQAEVDIYDSSHEDFRNIEEENNAILDTLAVKRDHIIIDFGAGTGTFAIQAARRCAKVFAIDVSQTMIDYAKTKAEKAAVSNIEFCHSGFLSYEHSGHTVDAVVTNLALHHLPDFWKGIALKRIYDMLKPSGHLYINDVILTDKNALKNITAFIDKQTVAGGDFLREDAEEHFREEYSTYDWIMEGLLLRSGFTIKNKKLYDGVMGCYLCTKSEKIT